MAIIPGEYPPLMAISNFKEGEKLEPLLQIVSPPSEDLRACPRT